MRFPQKLSAQEGLESSMQSFLSMSDYEMELSIYGLHYCENKGRQYRSFRKAISSIQQEIYLFVSYTQLTFFMRLHLFRRFPKPETLFFLSF